GFRLRRVVHGRRARCLRDADPRRAARRCDALHTPRRGRSAVGVRRSDHRRLGDGPGRAAHLRGRHLGPSGSGRPRHSRWTRMAQGVTIDAAFWGAEAAGIVALERELKRLRRAQSAHAREQARTVARAAVLNLVVYADRELHARRSAQSISDLASRHPSRAIVLLADRGAHEGAEGRLEMHCHLPTAENATQVCYEQILIRARGDADERLASVVDVPAWRPFLDTVTGVRVGFAVDMDGRQILPSQALLFIGWLASRLGWRPIEALAPSEAGGLLFAVARADGARIQIRVRPRFERGLADGDVSGVRIQAERDGQQAEFVIKRQPDPRHQTASVLLGGERRWERTMPLPSFEIVELIGEELA